MPKFQGGTTVDSKGYLRISAGPHRGKRVHILVAEAMLGRKLTDEEEVDHCNGDKLDCAHTNLKVLKGPDHTRLENRRRWVMRHIEAKERARWEEWIETGVETGLDASDDDGDTSTQFNPEELEA